MLNPPGHSPEFKASDVSREAYDPGAKLVQAGQSSTTVTSSANPAMPNQPVTFTAEVTDAGTPTGTVSFYDGTTFLGVGELTLVNGQIQATFTTAALGLGSHRILAVYTGDSTFADSGAALQQTISS